MIISFCGHSQFSDNCPELKNKIINLIKDKSNDGPVTFYLGGYGGFDGFAHDIANEYKSNHPDSAVIFVTPYLNDDYLKNREPLNYGYDEVIYPDIENTPKRYAILERNKWMVKKSDLLIAYVNYSWGGAVKTLEYAIQSKHPYVNFGSWEYIK